MKKGRSEQQFELFLNGALFDFATRCPVFSYLLWLQGYPTPPPGVGRCFVRERTGTSTNFEIINLISMMVLRFNPGRNLKGTAPEPFSVVLAPPQVVRNEHYEAR